MAESEEYYYPDYPTELYYLAEAFSTIVEIDKGLLDHEDSERVDMIKETLLAAMEKRCIKLRDEDN